MAIIVADVVVDGSGEGEGDGEGVFLFVVVAVVADVDGGGGFRLLLLLDTFNFFTSHGLCMVAMKNSQIYFILLVEVIMVHKRTKEWHAVKKIFKRKEKRYIKSQFYF